MTADSTTPSEGVKATDESQEVDTTASADPSPFEPSYGRRAFLTGLTVTALGTIVPTAGAEQRSHKISDREVIEFYREIEPPFLCVEKVAEEFDAPRNMVRKQLEELEEKGLFDSKSVGEVKIWWIEDQPQTAPSSGDNDRTSFTDETRRQGEDTGAS